MTESNLPRSGAVCRELLIAESYDLAHRWAPLASAELTVLVITDERELLRGDERYDIVTVAGFSASPKLLRSVVDRAFDLLLGGGVVRLGVTDDLIDTDPTTWEVEFADVSVFVDGRGAGVRLARDPAPDAGSGTLLLGVLMGMSLNHRVSPADPCDPPIDEISAAVAHPRQEPATVVRKEQFDSPNSRWWARAVGRRQVLLGIASASGVVACVASLLLVSRFGIDFIAVLLTLTVALSLGHAGRAEQREKRLNRRLVAMEQSLAEQRRRSRRLSMELRPRLLAGSVEKLAAGFPEVVKTVGVTQLMTSEMQHVLHQLGSNERAPKPTACPPDGEHGQHHHD